MKRSWKIQKRLAKELADAKRARKKRAKDEATIIANAVEMVCVRCGNPFAARSVDQTICPFCRY